MQLSIIIPCLNDPDILGTVKSIHETTGGQCEVIVVDDRSDAPLAFPAHHNTQVIRNTKRLGVAKSRHLGAEITTGKTLLFLDAHMVCEPGWFEKAAERIDKNPGVIYNGACLGLNSKTGMDLSKYEGVYSGASISFFNPVIGEILEGKWKSHHDNAEIPCLMGAIYFIPRNAFFCIGGLKSLEQWGTDEPYLSLKAWFSGREIRQLNTVRMGHKFRSHAPYRTETLWMPYNKIRSIMTIFNKDVSEFLISKFPKTEAVTLALNKIRERQKEIDEEREFNQSIFTRGLDWFVAKFPDVKHPLRP